MALRKKPPTTLLLTDMSSLYGYIYCMLISEGLSGMPLYGGALYMIGRVTTVFAQTFSPEEAIYLPKALRWMRVPLMILLLLLSLCLVVLYPMSFGSTQMWLIFSVVLSMQLRDSLCQRMGRLCLDGRMEQTTFLCLSGALHGCMMALQALILAVNLPVQLSVPMMIGYLLCGMAAFYSTYAAYEERAVLPRPNSEEAHFTLETIHRANALSAFERLSMVLLTAMEMTLIVMYTFLATTAEQMLIRMAIAVLTTLLCEELATLLLKKREKKNKNEPISLLLMGMFLWLYGLWIFSRMLRHHTTDISITYFCLALCSVGCAVCKVCLSKMESPMGAVAKFTSGQGNSRLSADAARVARSGFAAGADACACGADGAVLPCWAAAAAHGGGNCCKFPAGDGRSGADYGVHRPAVRAALPAVEPIHAESAAVFAHP